MKTSLRELLIDLKAAAAIGDPESLEAALAGFRRATDEDLSTAGMLAAGELLAALPPEQFLHLLNDNDAALRGVAAAAAVLRSAGRDDVHPDALLFAAEDPSAEVRAVIAQAAAQEAGRGVALAAEWLLHSSPSVRNTGLELVAAIGSLPEGGMAMLADYDAATDHEFRSALVAALNALAEGGAAGDVLALLEGWAGKPEPNVWVITRVLSGAWALAHSPYALAILETLKSTAGEIRPILRAEARHSDHTPSLSDKAE